MYAYDILLSLFKDDGLSNPPMKPAQKAPGVPDYKKDKVAFKQACSDIGGFNDRFQELLQEVEEKLSSIEDILEKSAKRVQLVNEVYDKLRAERCV